ncbi:hypothetical protein KAH43_01385 [Candidatus Bipolaricaulota bacterium]|nr:hypothetical protein [Candidatus Bipolaricaulota bacterium]
MSSESSGRDPFRWRSAGLFIGIAIFGLLIFRQYRVAGGVALGLALYASNLFLIMEIGRSLLRNTETRRPKPLAALSSAGRLFFLAIALSLTATFLGREVVLGACGGLLIAQVNLHIPRTGH